MYSKTIEIEGKAVTLMAKTQRDLEKHIQFLYDCQEPKMAQLESIPSRVNAPEFEVRNEPAIARVVRPNDSNVSPES